MNAAAGSERGSWPDQLYLVGCEPTRGSRVAEANATADTMGFKAWNLLRMAALGLPVPPAFVLGTGWSGRAAREGAGTRQPWAPGLAALEQVTGRRFGDERLPLLLSVRSGAKVSMPGMMESLLNIGLCERTLGGLLRQTGNPRLVWDSYRRLVANYGEVVSGLPAKLFEDEYAAVAGSRDERELDFAELRTLARRYLAAHAEASGRPFPQDPHAQLRGAVAAVQASWHSAPACAYRRQCGLDDSGGTAVTVQAMVFGNSGGRSGSGVGFTRDPATGEPALWVDFLFNAQGEDVVSGRRSAHGHEQFAAVLPGSWEALRDAAARLERSLGDMQDFEFTVQDARLYLLQTRTGKRTPQAAARIALDLLDEGVIDAREAQARTAALRDADLVRTRTVAADGQPLLPLARAASAGSGVAGGEIALDENRARARHAAGTPVVLVRRDAEAADIAALECATGLLTQRGARTSHAAVVARQLGKVCLVGCAALRIDEAARSVKIGDTELREGQWLTLDAGDGAVYAGEVRTATEPLAELRDRLARLRSQALAAAAS